MTTDNSTEKTFSGEFLPPKSQTSELFFENRNTDHVTGYPIETQEARGKIIEIISQAIKGQKVLGFVSGDMDNLKGVNDQCGHDNTNQGIKQFVAEREKLLLELEGAEAVLVYRPQSGGDEFRAIVIFGKDTNPNSVSEKISKKLAIPTKFTYSPKEGKSITLDSSFGISAEKFTGQEENAGAILQQMQEQAENILVKQKIKKIWDEVDKTTKEGQKLSPEYYIDLICQRWGSKRISPSALRILLSDLYAKVLNTHFSQQTNYPYSR